MIISKKVTKYFAIFIIAIFVLSVAMVCFTKQPTFAEEDENSSMERILGLKLSYKLDGKDSKVMGAVKVVFNIYLVDINVHIYLYSSKTYEESYEDMILRDWNYTSNLKVGQELCVEDTTGNERLYWKLRVRFRRSDKEWEEYISPVYLIDGDGNLVQ